VIPLSRRRVAGAALLTAAALTLTACGSSTSPSSSSSSAADPASSSAPASTSASTAASASTASSAASTGSTAASSAASSAAGGATQVTVTITDADGCVAAPDTVAAGPINFVVKNVDATGITELELVSEQRILGERENLTPGFDSTFSVRVDGGSYQIYCPGASTERRPFTVTGQAAQTTGNTADLLQQAAVEYGSYVSDQVSFLIPPVKEMQAAIAKGDLKAAQDAYAKARPFYERIEPVAESFPDLDPAIDLRIGDVESGQKWTGFHPIEQALFEKKTTKGLDALATQLVTDITKLQTLTTALEKDTQAKNGKGYQPFEIANGASGLLDEVLQSKITGEEETYSKLDLLDFEANVEGSLQAFATLEPALNQIDATVVPTISAKFDALTKLLNTYKDPKALGGWKPYTALTAADKKQLTDALLAVQEPLSQVASKITQ
jgi:iron uptake system component EfeO